MERLLPRRKKKTNAPFDLAGYDFLTLPDLPPRYQGLTLDHGWYVPGKNANRKHVKSHGLTSFGELARTVASNWKVVDDETKNYCTTVAGIIKVRHAALGGTMKKSKGSAKEGSQTDSKKQQRHQMNSQRRASMPNMVSMSTANSQSEWSLWRSSGTGDSKEKSKDSANMVSQTNSKNQQWYQMSSQRRASMPTMVTMANSPNGGSFHRSSSTGDRLGSSVTHDNIILCPEISSATQEQAVSNFHIGSTNLSVTQEQVFSNSNFYESINQIELMSSFNMPVPDMTRSTILNRNIMPKCQNSNQAISQVDMKDSAIHDMWKSAGD